MKRFPSPRCASAIQIVRPLESSIRAALARPGRRGKGQRSASDVPNSYDYQPNYYDSGDYQGQMYYDQNSYPDQSQGYYDSTVYQSEAYYDPNSYSDQSQSNYSIDVAAQERLAREGYYHGESDGVLSPEMQKAVRRYQITNGLRATGYLDADTLAVMGLQKGAGY
jgi:hypothetical protein